MTRWRPTLPRPPPEINTDLGHYQVVVSLDKADDIIDAPASVSNFSAGWNGSFARF